MLSSPNLTYEGIVDHIVEQLRRVDVLRASSVPIPWESFLRLSKLIHETYCIPSTTFTPMMRRLLFALGFAAYPKKIIGVGTYVGYTFSWLLRNYLDSEAAPFFQEAVGIDTDPQANLLARRNCVVLGHGERLIFLDDDGVSAIARNEQSPIDLLYIDIDDPYTGKAAYRQVLEAASPFLKSRALVLAHDACVPKFEKDFKRFHSYIRDSGLFSNFCILPVDNCGLSIAVVR